MTDSIHICASSDCDCGMSRRDFLRMSALGTAAAASPLLFAGDAMAQNFKGSDQPVKIGYLPITDAAPLLVAHGRRLFQAQGLEAQAPKMFRSWPELIEAFVAGQVNVIHMLSPATLWVRYGSKFPAKVVAWNHTNGSALTVQNEIDSVAELGGKTLAIPFWYSIHNVVLQKILTAHKLEPVMRARGSALKPNEVNLVVLPPAEMIAALTSKSIAGYIVAEPFNVNAELAGIGKVLRFSGDVWKNHACCVTFLAERDVKEKPEWAQRVTSAIVNAQLWIRSNQVESAELLGADGLHRYTPHKTQALSKVLDMRNYLDYERRRVVVHPEWFQRRIDFQPYPFASYTEELVRAMAQTKIEGDNGFLTRLDPKFVAKDLVEDRFVRKAMDAVGGPIAFGLPDDLHRVETIKV